MLGNTWVRLMCKIEYLGNGGSLESSVWVQSVNSWCIWLLIHKLFLKCCFALHFLFSIQLRAAHWIHSSMELMGWIAGMGGLRERGEGWGQAETKGRSTNWEAPGSRSNRKRGMSLQVHGSCFLAGGDVVRHWNGAVQFPELCSLCCPTPGLPAACTVTDISSQLPPHSTAYISQTKSFLPLLPTKRGQRSTNLSCSRHACSLGALGQRGICGRKRKFLH